MEPQVVNAYYSSTKNKIGKTAIANRYNVTIANRKDTALLQSISLTFIPSNFETRFATFRKKICEIGCKNMEESHLILIQSHTKCHLLWVLVFI